MLRRNVVVPVLALGLALIVAPAHAGGFTFGVNGGANMPTSDYATAFKLGWGGGVTADYGLMPMIGIGADLGYMTNTAKDDVNAAASAAAGYPVTISTSAFQYGLHGTVTPPMVMVHPYFQVGVGEYNTSLKMEGGGASTSGSSTKFGWNVGGGMNFTVAPTLALGVAATYSQISAKDDLGFNPSWFAVRTGLTFKMPTP